jgi:hypothetical protein
MQRISAPCNNQEPKEKMQREKEDLKKLRLDLVSLRNGSPVPLHPTCLAIVESMHRGKQRIDLQSELTHNGVSNNKMQASYCRRQFQSQLAPPPDCLVQAESMLDCCGSCEGRF